MTMPNFHCKALKKGVKVDRMYSENPCNNSVFYLSTTLNTIKLFTLRFVMYGWEYR